MLAMLVNAAGPPRFEPKIIGSGGLGDINHSPGEIRLETSFNNYYHNRFSVMITWKRLYLIL